MNFESRNDLDNTVVNICNMAAGFSHVFDKESV